MQKQMLCLIAVCSLALTAFAQTRRDVEPENHPYKRWLNEDVLYIIFEPEREAFLKLKTDEERERFIEQFWLRRDPNLDTEDNEFRNQHYERIAHANASFGFTQTPGWKTDRGRYLILYGLPDDIQINEVEHIWLYRNLPAFGGEARLRFVDIHKTGEYKLQLQ
jgi:GWxTD domain-containing protein